jgi:hypothetical protein
MNVNINNLSAASRKRITRQTIQRLHLVRHWYSDALMMANAAEYDGNTDAAAKWDEQARLYAQEYAQLEGSIA